jgi:hypothetical protein
MTEIMFHLDGNGVAGLLDETFGTDMTLAVRDCLRCGDHSVLGAHRAYVSAGVVLRCPGCDMVSLRITTLPDRHIVELGGAWKLEVRR